MKYQDHVRSIHTLSFPLQFCVSILSAVSAFTLVMIFSHKLLSESPTGFWHTSLHMLLTDCAATISALFTVYCIISKKYRILIGVPILYLLICYYIYRIIQYTVDWASLISNLFVLSMTLFFAVIILYFMNIPAGMEKGRTEIDIKPPLSVEYAENSLVFSLVYVLALISVPAAFLIVVLSAVMTIFICGWLFAVIISLDIPIITPFLLLLVIPPPFAAIGVTFKILSVITKSQSMFLPAVNIDLSKCPKLHELMTQIGTKVNAKSPDHVVLHAAPSFFVSKGCFTTYNGIINGTIFGISMILLNEPSTDELRLVIAHEDVHLTGWDTLYGSYVEPSHRLLISSMEELSKSITHKITYCLLFCPLILITIFYYHLLQVQEIIRCNRETRAHSVAAILFGYDSIKRLSQKIAVVCKFYESEYTNTNMKQKTDYFKEFSHRFKQASIKLEEQEITDIEKSVEVIKRKLDAKQKNQTLLTSELHTADDSHIIDEIKEELSDKEEELSLKFIEEIEKHEQTRGSSKNSAPENTV